MSEDAGDLERRILDVLRRLSMLSEGRSGTIAQQIRHPHADSALPPGVRLDKDPSGPPSKDVSLFDYYKWMFAHAPSDFALRRQLYLAEIDYLRHTGRNDHDRLAAQERIDLDPGPELSEARQKADQERIVDTWQGHDALEAAVYEGVSLQYIYRARQKYGMRRGDGMPRADWHSWSDEQKASIISDLHRQGATQERISHKLGITVRTVSRWWPKAA